MFFCVCVIFFKWKRFFDFECFENREIRVRFAWFLIERKQAFSLSLNPTRIIIDQSTQTYTPCNKNLYFFLNLTQQILRSNWITALTSCEFKKKKNQKEKNGQQFNSSYH